jgi:hypothetical protein
MPTAALATCQLYGTIYDVFGQPVAGAIVGVMAVYKNGSLILSRTKEVETDVDGYFTLDLPRDSVAVLYANTPGLNISCLGSPTAIPDADQAELASIVGDFELWDQVPVAIPIGAGVSSFNGRTGAVVLTSLDVTTALGYTPADQAALAGYLLLAGGTMTGPLALAADPTLAAQAASKHYVDQAIGSAIGAIPAGVSSFNARTGAVLPLVGDYAAFYAALVHTHTRAQITDLGIFSTSAPGLVPQPTAGDAAKVLTGAGTWAVVAAGVDTAANYTWTGLHDFQGNPTRVKQLMGPADTNVLQITGNQLLQLYSPTEIKISGAVVEVSANFTMAHLQFLHPTEIEFGMSALPASATALLHFSCFDTSFQQQDRYRLFGSGRHYYNAPKATTDNADATVTVWASDARVTSFTYALRSVGRAIFTGAVTLPADPTAALDAATKQYVDAHTSAPPPIFSTSGPGLVPAPATADPTKFLTAAGTFVSAGAASVDLAANYPWTGAHTWTSGVQLYGGMGRLGVNDTPKSYALVHVLSTGLADFVFEFTNNTDSAVYFQCATAGSVNNSRGRGRAYLSSYGDLLIGNHDGTPGNLPEFRAAFLDVGTLPYKRSCWIYGFPADANNYFVCTLTGSATPLFAVNVNGDVIVSRDPTVALGVATKQYVDATAATGVNLSADYAWTGIHTWAKAGTFTADFNGGGLSIKGGSSVISPTLNYFDEAAALTARIGVARTAGALIAGAGVGDWCFAQQGSGNCLLNSGGTFVLTANPTLGGVMVAPRLAVNGAIDNRTRVQVVTNYPDWSFSFTNGANASVNFAIEPTNILPDGVRGRSAMIYYGDFLFRRYVDGWAGDVIAMRLGLPATIAGDPAVAVYGTVALSHNFFQCIADSTPVFMVHSNGDVTLAHDPTSALHAVTKQYADLKLAKAGGTMTGLLTLSGNPSAVLDAAPKQYVDLRLLKAGDTMTGALTMSNVSIIQNSAALGALTLGVQEELLTLATGALTTDTAGNLLPANSIILSVTGRITTTINNITNWKLGDATVADRFSAVSTTLTSGTTVVGLNMWDASRVTAGMGQIQAAAAKVRVTVTGTQNTAGAIRITTRYLTVAAATS